MALICLLQFIAIDGDRLTASRRRGEELRCNANMKLRNLLPQRRSLSHNLSYSASSA